MVIAGNFVAYDILSEGDRGGGCLHVPVHVVCRLRLDCFDSPTQDLGYVQQHQPLPTISCTWDEAGGPRPV